MASFRSGNFDFIVIATHTRWGDSLDARQAELQLLADWIDVRFKSELVEDNDLIVMGDFNIPKLDDRLFKALTSRGLRIPECLRELRVGDRVINGSNLGTDARYDQILHLPTLKDRFTNEGGALDFFISDARIKELFPSKDYTRQQFSYQLSDHFPVWAQIKTDIETQRLTQIIQTAKKQAVESRG
jgi:endonuclease/exonuclease/phosphatase family metal-dependent hydrolase